MTPRKKGLASQAKVKILDGQWHHVEGKTIDGVVIDEVGYNAQ